jgi:hypothetical protein
MLNKDLICIVCSLPKWNKKNKSKGTLLLKKNDCVIICRCIALL